MNMIILSIAALVLQPTRSGCEECGNNSPFIGHELNLDGEANNHEGKSRLIAARHPTLGSIDLAQITVVDHELQVHPVGSATAIVGHDLRGLVLEVVVFDELAQRDRIYNIELRQYSNHLDSSFPDGIRFWPRWGGNEHLYPGPVPSYRFEVYDNQGNPPFMLCPIPDEDYIDHNEFLKEAPLSCASDDHQSSNLSCYAGKRNTDFHAVLFVGDRYDASTKVVSTGTGSRWLNIGCKGSASYKMHLSGYTSAAAQVRQNRSIAPSTDATNDQKQTMLYAITGKYHRDELSFTVPGQQLRYDNPIFHSGVNQFANYPGSYEALWGPQGVVCLGHPRRTQARKHDFPALDYLSEIRSKFSPKKLSICTESELESAHQSIAAGQLDYLITYVPSSCMVVHEDGTKSCSDPDKVEGCYCDSACEHLGDCCYDYHANLCPDPPTGCLEADENNVVSCIDESKPGKAAGCYCDSDCEKYKDCCGDYDPSLCAD